MNKQNLLSVVSSLILFASVPVVLAWTAPTATPPAGNAPAPVNVSSNPQIKTGFLGLYGPASSMAISQGDQSYILRNGLSLGVKGKIGADFFCNADGTVCADINQLLGNNTVNSTTTINGCRYEQATSTLAINAGGSNNKGSVQNVATLIPGTWKVYGSGTAGKGCGDKCGSPSAWIRVTKNKSNTAVGYKSLVSKLGKWTIPETTFVLDQEEVLRASGYEALIKGSVTLVGPRLVCPTN